jgi:cancer susceptibility candidate protein 1
LAFDVSAQLTRDLCRSLKEKLKEDKTNIDFQMIKMTLLMPAAIKCTAAAIRGLWVNFDHMSDYCFSTQFKYDDSDRKKMTLRRTTKREWKKRKELLQKALFQIFNEKPDESSDADPSQPRMIDVDKIYTEYEDELNAIERRRMGPESLGLGEFEVNLRRNKIVGGVFQIEYLEQPLQDLKTDEGALLRTRNCTRLLAQRESMIIVPLFPIPSCDCSDSSGGAEEEALSLSVSDARGSEARPEESARGN